MENSFGLMDSSCVHCESNQTRERLTLLISEFVNIHLYIVKWDNLHALRLFVYHPRAEWLSDTHGIDRTNIYRKNANGLHRGMRV